MQMNFTEQAKNLKDGTATIIRQLNFQDYEGEYVDITADFVEFGDDRQTDNKGVNASVENISINGEKVNEDHIWIRNVVQFNPSIWGKVNKGDRLNLYGDVYSYGKSNKKYSINLDHYHFKNSNPR